MLWDTAVLYIVLLQCVAALIHKAVYTGVADSAAIADRAAVADTSDCYTKLPSQRMSFLTTV